MQIILKQDTIDDPVDSYRVEVFRRVIDQITTSIVERFSNNYELVTDTACVDPHRLQELRENGLWTFTTDLCERQGQKILVN
jgi:hypothetical protein